MQARVGDPYTVGSNVHVLPSAWAFDEEDVLPINAFLLHGSEPILIDTGAGALGDDFLEALASVLPLARLRWIWVTHEDPDHTGNLDRLLDLAPRAQVIASPKTIHRLEFSGPLPADRLRPVGQGEAVTVGNHRLGALRPPLFDSPATTGFLDQHSRILFSSDCFGAPMAGMEEALARDASEMPEGVVAQAQVSWARSDSPWVRTVDEDAFTGVLERVRRLQPSTILSTHAPPLHGGVVERSVAALRQAASGGRPSDGGTAANGA